MRGFFFYVTTLSGTNVLWRLDMEAHERSNEVFLKLAERGIITIYDYIDEEMVAHVRDRLAVAEAHNVPEIDVRSEEHTS